MLHSDRGRIFVPRDVVAAAPAGELNRSAAWEAEGRTEMQVMLRDFIWPLLGQLALFVISVCGLPQNVFMRACVIASLGFWLGVLLIVIRRRSSLTQGDLEYIRRGMLPVGILGMIAAFLYWELVMGISDIHNPRNIPRPGELTPNHGLHPTAAAFWLFGGLRLTGGRRG